MVVSKLSVRDPQINSLGTVSQANEILSKLGPDHNLVVILAVADEGGSDDAG